MNIFISYSNKSRAVVDALTVDLDALGHTVWFDRRLTGGHDWWEEILSGIRHCHLFLFALTPEALESQPCKLEYEYAIALNKRILPVMLTDINIALLPISLQKFQLVDYRQQNKTQALSLGRALGSLPRPKALPKPMPPKPEMPLSPIAKLRDLIDAPSLKPDEQRVLITKLKTFLEDDVTANDARLLLKRVREREDLLAWTEREIARLLGGRLAIKGRVKKSHIPLEPRTFSGHTEAVFSVAYSPSGRYILTGSVDKTARLWDAVTGEEVRQFVGHTGSIWTVAYSPNGRTIITASRDASVRLWDSASGKELHQFTGHTDTVWGVAYSPDAHTIVTGSFDRTARLWDLGTKRELRKFVGHAAAVWGVAFSPDGRYVLTGSWDKTARLWDAATGKEVRQFTGHTGGVVSVAFSPDGSTILTGSLDSTARIWEVSSGKELQQFGGHIAFSVTYPPDGCFVLTGSADKTAWVWDSTTGQEQRQFIGHADAVTSVAYAPDGRTALTGSADKTARLWNVRL